MSAITAIDAHWLKLPFKPDGAWGEMFRNALDLVLVRVETADGLVGWGDAFAYHCAPAVKYMVESTGARLIGEDSRNIRDLNYRMQQQSHLFGRYGITIFAIGGIDIALWDLAGKRAGRPIAELIGGPRRSHIPAYASLIRYGDAEVVGERTQQCLDEGYRNIKLHEITEDAVRRGREVAGDEVPLMIDCNCPWHPTDARRMAEAFAPYDPHWLEEPIFPPEDFASLAWLQAASGIPIAAGENACTAFEFQKMFEAGAVTYAQPSVTKVGGITEFLKIITMAELHGINVVPHSPYFGPGFVATLHLLSILPDEALSERFILDLEVHPMGRWTLPTEGGFAVPDGPGLGIDPDPDAIKDLAAKA